MTPEETLWLISQTKDLTGNIAEVGCWSGITTRNVALNTKATYYAVDAWPDTLAENTDPSIAASLADMPNGAIYKEFLKTTKDLPNVRAIRTTTTEAARFLTGIEFDFVFIDAAHDYESVKGDILAWLPLVRDGGILCGHDWGQPFEVEKAVDELFRSRVIVPGTSIWAVRKGREVNTLENINMPGGLLVGLTFMRERLLGHEWFMAMQTMNMPIATNLTYFTTMDMEIGKARNAIAEKALEMGTKYVFMIDDDTAPPNFAARKLIYELEQHDDAMVCAGIYCSKEDPPFPIVFMDQGRGAHWDWLAGDVFPCYGIGTGCMMIKTEVFRKIEAPWFCTVDKEPVDAQNFSHKMTDDLYFCDKVRQAGYKILAHGGVNAVHWDAKTHRPYMLPTGCKPLREYEAALAEGLDIASWREKHKQVEQVEAAHAGD